MRDATPWYAFDTHVVGTYQEERGLRIARSMFDCTLYRVSLLPYPPTTFSPLPPRRHPACFCPILLLRPFLSLLLSSISLDPAFFSRDFDHHVSVNFSCTRATRELHDNDTTPTCCALEEDRVKAIERRARIRIESRNLWLRSRFHGSSTGN